MQTAPHETSRAEIVIKAGAIRGERDPSHGGGPAGGGPTARLAQRLVNQRAGEL
jgi:hypothetical protein